MNFSRFCTRSSRLFHQNTVELKAKCVTGNCNFLCSSQRQSSNASIEDKNRNPTPVFFLPEVQSLLKQLTAMDLKKVFQQRREQKRMKAPVYQFMTSEELEKAINKAKEEAEIRLQMPPVLLPRSPIDSTLAKDPAIQGYSSCKFVFTDISYGKLDRERLIVVRDPDGTLRKASWEERDRINQTYFPVAGRSWTTPKMFESDYLEALLAKGSYEFVLDRACLQFEPDDPLYISVTQQVYEHINENRSFDSLRSTRFFGPLVFYLAWNRKVDNLILECLQNERIHDAVRTVQLLYIIHPSLKSSTAASETQDPFMVIKMYAESNSSKQGSIELALQSYQEKMNQLKQLTRGLEEAHGHR